MLNYGYNRYWLSLRPLTWLERLGMFLQISNKLHDDILRYKIILIWIVISNLLKTLINSAKNHVQIACAKLTQLISPYNLTRNLLLFSGTLVLFR